MASGVNHRRSAETLPASEKAELDFSQWHRPRYTPDTELDVTPLPCTRIRLRLKIEIPKAGRREGIRAVNENPEIFRDIFENMEDKRYDNTISFRHDE